MGDPSVVEASPPDRAPGGRRPRGHRSARRDDVRSPELRRGSRPAGRRCHRAADGCRGVARASDRGGSCAAGGRRVGRRVRPGRRGRSARLHRRVRRSRRREARRRRACRAGGLVPDSRGRPPERGRPRALRRRRPAAPHTSGTVAAVPLHRAGPRRAATRGRRRRHRLLRSQRERDAVLRVPLRVPVRRRRPARRRGGVRRLLAEEAQRRRHQPRLRTVRTVGSGPGRDRVAPAYSRGDHRPHQLRRVGDRSRCVVRRQRRVGRLGGSRSPGDRDPGGRAQRPRELRRVVGRGRPRRRGRLHRGRRRAVAERAPRLHRGP